MKALFIFLVVALVVGGGYLLWFETIDDGQSAEQESQPPEKDVDLPEKIPSDVAEHIKAKSDLIVVTSPKPLEIIKSPVVVSGLARGFWFFEASFPIIVTDWDGQIIGQGLATADGEWMTEEFVPFSSEVTFSVSSDTPYKRGVIILKKDNPSGLPQHDDALEIPVRF